MNEQQITGLMDRVGDSLEPDVRALVAAGTARGRAFRRRRRAGAALGVVAAVVATAVVVPVVTADDAAGPTVTTAPSGTGRTLAVAPADMSTTLAGLLPGSRVADDGEEFRYGYVVQVQRGRVLWHGEAVTVAIDARSVGTTDSARERCQAMAAGRGCDQEPGGAWVFEHGTIGVDTRTGEQERTVGHVTVYVPGGYLVDAYGEEGQRVDRELLRRIALDPVWFG